MMNSAPTRVKPWLCGGDDASHIYTDGGIMLGHTLMPRPL